MYIEKLELHRIFVEIVSKSLSLSFKVLVELFYSKKESVSAYHSNLNLLYQILLISESAVKKSSDKKKESKKLDRKMI